MVKFFKKLIKSHKTALRGVLRVYATEMNFRIQFWFGLIVLTETFYWPLSEIKRLILLLLIMLVWLAEILNTTFEKLFDVIEKRYNNKIGYLKDILSGGVLVVAIGSVIIGSFIFWPYILKVITLALIESAIIAALIYISKGIRRIIRSKEK